MKEVNKLWDYLHKNSNEVVICPTKVGYIICAISLEGLHHYFMPITGMDIGTATLSCSCVSMH